MKRLGVIIAVMAAFVMTGCIKEQEGFDYVAQLEREKPIIQEYVEQYLPNATYDEYTSIWYEVLQPGDPESYEYKIDAPSGQVASPRITVNYEGKLLNGIVFDFNDAVAGAEFELSSLVTAWHAAFLPKNVAGYETIGITAEGLKKGSEIRIVTPSYLGYRDQRYGSIPANSPLDFTIKVLDIR